MLKGKKILLGITGSIAAYKAAFFVRLLVKQGAQVKVILTPDATHFISPLTLSVLSKNPVYTHAIDQESQTWNNHVELALWADLLLIAPASANSIAKMACGLCDNLLMAVYLSAKCPVMIAPAMDLDMFKHFTLKQNLATLQKNGIQVLPSPKGELASGLDGEGRMDEPEHILKHVEAFFKKKNLLKGKTVLITAGPTYEKIDPVRFIGNFSSGKMGFALADQAAQMGAKVVLVTGPVNLECHHPNIERLNVESAQEMFAQTKKHASKAQVLILSAAVADYTPISVAKEKIKKSTALSIDLQKTTDILSYLGANKTAKQVLCGFALESQNELAYAQDKLTRKKADLIVLNSIKNKGAGFKHDTNQISIISHKTKPVHYPLKDKQEVAWDILDYILTHYKV